MKTLTKKQEEKVELINCVSWLFLDASWMFSLKFLCYAFIAPTILTGLILIFGVKTLSLKFANLGIMSWSLMNIFWMCSEFFEAPWMLHTAYGLFALGTSVIGFVVFSRPDVKKGLVRRVGTIRNLVRPR